MTEDIRQIKSRGFRLTNPRKSILSVLSDVPQRVSDIEITLKRLHIRVDTVTVYRTLNWLVDLGIASRTTFQDGSFFYERNDNTNHHHHIICTVCNKVDDIPLNDEILLRQAKKETDFTILRHCVEFFGLCKDCQRERRI